MPGLLFFLGSFFIEGGLVLLLMWLVTAGERVRAQPTTDEGLAEPERRAA
ncbi:MAG TPA: hypothetical protein VNN12_09635 [Dehalococcoidia bacterium]|jgi:hypothetical protein|nr:hypothetical protein [Dehalococcoidia bacterium]